MRGWGSTCTWTRRRDYTRNTGSGSRSACFGSSRLGESTTSSSTRLGTLWGHAGRKSLRKEEGEESLPFLLDPASSLFPTGELPTEEVGLSKDD